MRFLSRLWNVYHGTSAIVRYVIMAEDHSALASKILLMRAGNQSKAKSWLSASLPVDENKSLESQDPVDDLTGVVDDDNAGIGAPRKDIKDDDFSNRQLLSANDALRKKLLSKDAYSRFKEGRKVGLEASKPMPRKVIRDVDDESEEEGKGRLGKGLKTKQKMAASVEAEVSEVSSPAVNAPATSIPSKKKRPASYLDQLLAERSKKKSKSKVENG